MNTSISKYLHYLFLVDMVFAITLGVALWIIPGRVLVLLGWVPDMVLLPESTLKIPGNTFVDPALIRVLGAAVLALGISSYFGWHARTFEQVKLTVQTEVIFCLLGTVGMLVGLIQLSRPVPIIGYVFLLVMVGLTAAWGWALRKS